jgi:uncharacterized protein YjbI with pentapeptide repeats
MQRRPNADPFDDMVLAAVRNANPGLNSVQVGDVDREILEHVEMNLRTVADVGRHSGVPLPYASLLRMPLGRSDLAGVNLTGANLTGANLPDADLTGANLTEAVLDRANLARAKLGGTNLTGADLTSTYLAMAYLAGANLTSTRLTRAELAGADLTGADLTGADLTGADLTGADLTGADLTGARWSLNTRWPGAALAARMRAASDHEGGDAFTVRGAGGLPDSTRWLPR